jgi:exodeoxyribonuclease I
MAKVNPTFYFYDLETSGFNPRTQRIMQFAGQRTTLDLEPIGEPDDMLISLTRDVLPDPDAVLVTGITPQRTQAEGVSEKEFLDYFHERISLPGTIFTGFNSIRFDDEFMRYLHYRNLHDAYEWQWKDGRSRWDLLDVTRMTRALRPDGINWPFASDGSKANRLELLTAVNNLDHAHAHNALSDVQGSIEVARLIRDNQPRLFDYLLDIRDKHSVQRLLEANAAVVYTSGSYPGEFEKTTVVVPIGNSPEPGGGSLVFDVRIDPDRWLKDESYRSENRAIKILKYNRCPAIAPLTVLDPPSWERIGLTADMVNERVVRVCDQMHALAETYEPKKIERTSLDLLEPPLTQVDGALYDAFVPESDRKLCDRIVAMNQQELTEFSPQFSDVRLPGLYFLYRARQFPRSLLAEDRARWEAYLSDKLLGGETSLYQQYMDRLNELAKSDYLDADKRYVLEELALYGQSVVPSDGF